MTSLIVIGVQVAINCVLTHFSTILIDVLFAIVTNYATLLAHLSSLSFIFPSLISSAVALSIVSFLKMLRYSTKVTTCD